MGFKILFKEITDMKFQEESFKHMDQQMKTSVRQISFLCVVGAARPSELCLEQVAATV